MIKRTITAFFLILFIYLLSTQSSALIFFIFLQVFIYTALYELLNLINIKNEFKIIIFIYSFLISLYFYNKIISLEIIAYVILLSAGLILLRTTRENDFDKFPANFALSFFTPFYLVFTLNFLYYIWKINYNHLFFLIIIISIGDTAAYFIGSSFGKHKIFPHASPKKSFEGFFAAIIFSIISAYILFLIFYEFNLTFILVSGAIIPLSAQLSDPIESLFKRHAGVKDSSKLLPGHGGFLDRVDSYIFSAPLFFLLIRYFGVA